MDLQGCRGKVCLTMLCSMDCRGISAPAPGAPPLPSSALALVSAELFLSHVLTPLYWLLCHSCYLFLNMLSQRRYQCRWWARPWPSVGPSQSQLVTGSVRHGGGFWHLLTEVTPVALQLPKPCHINTMHCAMLWALECHITSAWYHPQCIGGESLCSTEGT